LYRLSWPNVPDNHLDLENEPNQDKMNAIDEEEEHIQDIENLFNQRPSESMEIDIGNTIKSADQPT
jgi:hypothetical protein